jgi:hypothetical protein
LSSKSFPVYKGQNSLLKTGGTVSLTKIQRKEMRPKAPIFDEYFPDPSGLLADLVDYGLGVAPHPDKDVALAGALGLVSALVGRRYLYNGVTLNLYQGILAPSSYGKSAAHNMITHALLDLASPVDGEGKRRTRLDKNIVSFVRSRVNHAADLYTEVFPYQQSFVWLIDELSKIEGGWIDSTMKRPELQAALLELWSTHLAAGEVRGRQTEAQPVMFPALSILGNAVEQVFFQNLTVETFEGGMFGRYIFYVIRKDKPYLQQQISLKLPVVLRGKLMALAKQGLKSVGPGQSMETHGILQLKDTKEARAKLAEFDRYCTDQTNRWYALPRENRRPSDALWGRMPHKAMKLAALHAVSRTAAKSRLNSHLPLVDEEDVDWAIAFVQHEHAVLDAVSEDYIFSLSYEMTRARRNTVMRVINRLDAQNLADWPKEARQWVKPNYERFGGFTAEGLYHMLPKEKGFNEPTLSRKTHREVLTETLVALVEDGELITEERTWQTHLGRQSKRKPVYWTPKQFRKLVKLQETVQEAG